jgi:MATE family multidrug resistance protein
LQKEILRLAIPNIISNLSVPLLSSVDAVLMGHLAEPYYLGAVAVGGIIFNFIYWSFGFLRMGTTGLIAQAYGKKDSKEILLILYRALLTALIIGLIIILIQSIISRISFSSINASDDVEEYAKTYFYIRIYAAPAVLALYVFQGWFLGMQNARYPLYILVFLNIVNIFFNILFVKYFKMNADGVALGTVFAQYFGLALAVFLYFKFKIKRRSNITLREIIDIASIKKFFSVNFDIFIRTIALIFAFSFFTAKSAEFGDVVLGANTILLQLWTIFAYGVDGFAFAAESLIGKYKGAMDYDKLKRAVYSVFVWGITLGLGVTVIYVVFLDKLINIFTSNQQMAAVAISYAAWTIYTPAVNTVCYIWDGIYIGATATKAMRNAMLFVTLGIYIPAYYLTKDMLGNHSLWFSLSFFMFMRGVTLSVMAKKYIFNFNKF